MWKFINNIFNFFNRILNLFEENIFINKLEDISKLIYVGGKIIIFYTRKLYDILYFNF